jgi:neutral ceramidase
MHSNLTAGVALREISPKEGVPLGGYPHHPRYNKGVHDPLYASCLFLEDGVEKIALITTDVIGISKKYVREIRAQIKKNCGIPEKNILITASHSHSAPRMSTSMTMDAMEGNNEPDQEYVNSVICALVDLVIEATSNSFPAEIGIDKGYCGREQGVGGNRRDSKGIADPEVWTIGVKDDKGVLRGVFLKYTLHPTFLHYDNFQVSADYPGYIRKYVKKIAPEAVFLFAQGTSGNQSPRYFRSGKTFAEAERVGTEIGKEVERVLDQMEFSSEVPLSVSSKEIEVDLRKLPDKKSAEAEVEKYKSAWEKLKESGASEPDVWNAELLYFGAEDTLSLLLLKEAGKLSVLTDNTPMEVQVISIGDTKIACLPGEIFVEYGITIQYRSPFAKTFVVELANGLLPGYAATAQAYASGGYETGASMLTAKSGEQLVDTAVELLYDMKGQYM